ncbi:MAG: CapA family protein [Spirochaetales bacterium]|nr:CapA family protein [Spirochaetales bacterium]
MSRTSSPGALAASLVFLLLASCSVAPERAGEDPDASASLPMELAVASLPDPEPAAIRFLAVGDILLDRLPGARIAREGWKAPFASVKPLVEAADLAFANLECPASYPGEPYPGKPENVTFNADPGALLGLAWAGFDVVSLANNHMNDYGPKAVAETLEALDLAGVARSGAGTDLGDAREPAWLEAGGAEIAVLSYAEAWWSVTGAGETTPGVAHAVEAHMVADVGAALAKGADYVLVSVHWGEEHARSPNAFQRSFGRSAIDAGAAAVLGHHPHVLQGVERYGRGVILYSMGNFVFDMEADSTYDSAAFVLTLAEGGVEALEIRPLRIDRGLWAPRAASGPEGERILGKLAAMCAELGTELAFESGAAFLR